MELQDEIVRQLVDLGCADAMDLAGRIKGNHTTDGIAVALKGLEDERVVQRVKDPKDKRIYEFPPYELAR